MTATRAGGRIVILLVLGLTGCGRSTSERATPGPPPGLLTAWSALNREAAVTDSLVAAGRMIEAGRHARALRDTAALLPGVSGPYVSTRQGPLTYALRDIQTQTDTLCEAARQGDSLRVWMQSQKLRRAVSYIGGLYPVGLLPAGAPQPAGPDARTGPPRVPATSMRRLACPMHPEVTQLVPADTTGAPTCPKCGMPLAFEEQPAGAAPGRTTGNSPATPAPPARHMDHRPRHGGQFAMQGDYHLELVTQPDGLMQLYLYDAWTKPLALKGATAEITLEIREGNSGTTELTVPLRVKAEATGLLTARAAEVARAVAATVRVTLPDTSFSLTFPLDATGTGEAPGAHR